MSKIDEIPSEKSDPADSTVAINQRLGKQSAFSNSCVFVLIRHRLVAACCLWPGLARLGA